MMVPTEPVIILQQGATTFGIQNQFFTRKNFLLSFSPSVDDPKLKYERLVLRIFCVYLRPN